MAIYDLPTDAPVQVVMVLQAAAPKTTLPQKLPAITLDMPWIVPNDPQYLYQPGRFIANLAASACTDLLQGYKFKFLGWQSPTCRVLKIVKFPKHGTLIDEGNGAYGFRPTDGHLGRDGVQYIVEGKDGRRILITMPIVLQTMAKAFSYIQLTGYQRSTRNTTLQRHFEFSNFYAKAPGLAGGELGVLTESSESQQDWSHLHRAI